jgi:dsDNA-binding SOS-regulon protein
MITTLTTIIVLRSRFRLSSAVEQHESKMIVNAKPECQSSLKTKEHTMILTAEQRETVAGELKRFATELNLSDDQRQKLSTFLAEAREKVEEYKQQNPGATREDLIKKVTANRTALRERLVNFLTPEQLTKWDAGVANAKEFLGQKVAA